MQNRKTSLVINPQINPQVETETYIRSPPIITYHFNGTKWFKAGNIIIHRHTIYDERKMFNFTATSKEHMTVLHK